MSLGRHQPVTRVYVCVCVRMLLLRMGVPRALSLRKPESLGHASLGAELRHTQHDVYSSAHIDGAVCIARIGVDQKLL